MISLLQSSSLPVEITNQTDWWQPYVPPLVGLLGSIIVAAAAFYGVTKNNRTNQRAIDAADARQVKQLETARAERLADRAAERADKFREDVASILAERWPVLDTADELADAVLDFRRDQASSEVTQVEQVARFNEARLERRGALNHFIQLTIRASLLTNDPEILALLKDLRVASADGWNKIKDKFYGTGNPHQEARAFREVLNAKLGELEALTRRLVTADDADSPATQGD